MVLLSLPSLFIFGLVIDARADLSMHASRQLLSQRAESARRLHDTGDMIPRYVIIGDAGSTKTKLNIYSLKGHAEKPEVTSLGANIKMGPLTEYTNKLDDLRADFNDLILKAHTYIKPDARAGTPFHILGTAGMRSLPVEKQEELWKVVRSVIDKSGYEFQMHWAHTMTGKQEAGFLYASLNYAECDGDISCVGKKGGSVGELDMGGSSMQIGFKPTTMISVDDSSVLDDNDIREEVYEKSFTGYGQNDALLSVQEDAYSHEKASNSSFNNRVPFPCWLAGYEETVDKLFDAQVTAIFYGTSNYNDCKRQVIALLELDPDCNRPPCSIRGKHIEAIRGRRFYGVSGFRFAVANFGLSLTNTTPADLDAEAQKFCRMTSSEAQAAGYATPWKFISNQCFLSLYAYEVLTKAFHFAADSHQIRYDDDLDWSLGAAVSEIASPDLQELFEVRRPISAGFAGDTAVSLYIRVLAALLVTAVASVVFVSRYLKRPAANFDAVELQYLNA